MPNVISSAIFCARNVDKAENQGKVGRWSVAAGQAKKVADHVSTLDNTLGREAQAAIDAFKTASKSSKALEYAGKAVDFAAKNINPLICVSSGIDVLMADDKESALVTNTAALTSMFAGEKLMKEYMDEIPKIKGVDRIAEKVLEFAKKFKCEGKLPSIIHGVAFVTGSCLAYSAGEGFGKLLLGQTQQAK